MNWIKKIVEKVVVGLFFYIFISLNRLLIKLINNNFFKNYKYSINIEIFFYGFKV